MNQARPDRVGPILYARGAGARAHGLSALVVDAAGREPPELTVRAGERVEPVLLYARHGRRAWRFDFDLSLDSMASYRLDGEPFPVDNSCTARHRIAYLSCNGQEHDDQSRARAERNVMWRRLIRDHETDPFGLILHGGDQLYADEVVEAHPILRQWAGSDLQDRARFEFTAEVEEAVERFFLERYEALLTQPEIAWVSARVPALMIWDDHDIFDGWGSRPEPVLDSPIGQGLLRIARRMFLLFQHGTADAPVAEVLHYPRLTLVLPDLRSERRPTRVMGPEGWQALEQGLASARPEDRILLLSSVPVLGPRLSWVEAAMSLIPGSQKFEDDLRDQWQSRWHRGEWRRLLDTLQRRVIEHGNPITILSGEIHLATRAEMPLANGAPLHQLVSSGIAHQPPPRLYARALGVLASVGESPLPGQRIRMRPLPGRRETYTTERNYLVVERRGEQWTAAWELEHSGRTAPLRL